MNAAKKHKHNKLDDGGGFDQLPSQVLVRICMTYLHTKDILNLRLLSRSWRHRVDRMPQLWTKLSVSCHDGRSMDILSTLERLLQMSRSYLVSLSLALFHKMSLPSVWQVLSQARVGSLKLEKLARHDPMSTKAFCPLYSLTSLALFKCHMTDVNLCLMVTSCPSLTSLQLIQCHINTDPTIARLAMDHEHDYRKIASYAPAQLEEVTIRNVVLSHSSVIEKHRWPALKMMLRSPSLKGFSFGGCSFSSSLLYEIVTKYQSTLKAFSLNRCNLIEQPAPDHVRTVTMALGLLANITTLHLSHVAIDVGLLSTTLMGLTDLDLGYQPSFTDEMLLCIGQLNPSLTKISIEGCQRITATALVTFIQCCSLLEYVNISKCLLTVGIVLDALCKPTALLPCLAELVVQYPVGLTVSTLIAFLRRYGSQLALLDITGQSTISLEDISYCQKYLLSYHCIFKAIEQKF